MGCLDCLPACIGWTHLTSITSIRFIFLVCNVLTLFGCNVGLKVPSVMSLLRTSYFIHCLTLTLYFWIPSFIGHFENIETYVIHFLCGWFNKYHSVWQSGEDFKGTTHISWNHIRHPITLILCKQIVAKKRWLAVEKQTGIFALIFKFGLSHCWVCILLIRGATDHKPHGSGVTVLIFRISKKGGGVK